MDNLILIIGFLLCFLLGAYIREPFYFKEQKKENPITSEELKEQMEKEKEFIKEWNNLLNYTGEVNEEDEY